MPDVTISYEMPLNFTTFFADMPNVTTSYGRFSGSIRFLGNFNALYVIFHQTFINFVES